MMTEAQMTFIEDMGQLMVGWGIPRNTGRIYAYLLLQREPATLDDIAGELHIAKSGASVAARQLAQLGHRQVVEGVDRIAGGDSGGADQRGNGGCTQQSSAHGDDEEQSDSPDGVARVLRHRTRLR